MAKPWRERVTMEDIAKLAGVAKITVSRALQDSPLVRMEVRERVKAVARKHGYRLNTTARNLRLQRTHSITAVIEMDPSSDRPISEPFIQMLVGGLLNELAMARYQLVLTTRSMIEASGAADADGIVLLGQGANDEATQRIREFGLPFVVWGVPRGDMSDAVFVCSDNFEGGALVGRHFLELGRRKIVYLGDPLHSEVSERLRGLTNALGRKAKLVSIPCEFSQSAGRAAINDLLDRKIAFDAVATASDAIALGAMSALNDAKKAVPQDVAVVGYDDTAGETGLSSVRQEWALGGSVLGKKILQIVSGKRAAAEQMPVQLIVRNTSRI